jgi:hypothetical protein
MVKFHWFAINRISSCRYTYCSRSSTRRYGYGNSCSSVIHFSSSIGEYKRIVYRQQKDCLAVKLNTHQDPSVAEAGAIVAQ